MFCNQCEQTAKGTGCTAMGVCGKKPEVSALQDLLLHAVKGLSIYACEGRKAGLVDAEVNKFTAEAVFSTLTNVDFDLGRLQLLINRCVELREVLKEKLAQAGGNATFSDPSTVFQPAADLNGLVKQGEAVGKDRYIEFRNNGSLQGAVISFDFILLMRNLLCYCVLS